MSVFTLSDEKFAELNASVNPVVIGTRDVLLSQFEIGAAAEANLAKVAEAKAEAGKALDESDVAEAVEYRKLVAKAEKFREDVAAKAKAAADAVMAEYAEKLSAGKSAVSDARSKALSALSDSAADAIDTTADAAAYTGAVAMVSGLTKLYASQGLDLEFRATSVDKIVNGKGTRVGAAGKSGVRRQRWESLTVNGEEVGTLSAAGKAMGLSQSEARDAKLLDKFEAQTGSLVPGQTYTIVVTVNGTDFTLVGQPKAGKGDDDNE